MKKENTELLTPKKARYGIWQEETVRHGRCWRYDVRVLDTDGQLRRKTGSGFASKAECETAVAALRLAARENKYGLARPKAESIVTVGQVVDAYGKYLNAKWTAKHGAEYAKRNLGQINAIGGWTQFVGEEKSVKAITKQDFYLWAQAELTRGIRASSVQRRINNIRAALNYAREIYPVLKNLNIPRYSLGKEAMRERVRILDETEIKVLAAALQSKKEWRDAYDFFRIALGAGGRFDEIAPVVVRRDMTTAGIKWTDINRNGGTVRLFSGKTGKERIIYVPSVVDILLERKRARLGDAVHAFNFRDHWVRKVFSNASKECKIPYGQKTPGGWTVHDLRHTCLTNLLQNGVDLATVRDFAGHSSIGETSKYVHTTEKSKMILAQAASNLIALA